MSTVSVPRLLAIAALSAPLVVAAPASASTPKFKNCAGTANHGDQQNIKVRVVTCPNAIAFLNKIATMKPTSIKQSGAYTVASLKTNGWTCTLRFKTPTTDPNADTTARGACSASKKRAIHWVKK